MVQNKSLIFASYPDGLPVPGKDLVVETREVDLNKVPQGGVIVKNHYVSYDPYQRGRMRKPEVASYSMPFKIGEPITNRGISTIAASDSPDWKVGDQVIVEGTGTEEYTVLESSRLRAVRKFDNPLGLDPTLFIGALGMQGLTAWASLYEIGQPKKGETLFVSAASGAVGALVGQLGKKEGLKVIGSVGDDAKLDYIVNELGFDGGFNYKKEKPLDALKRLLPEGIDIYYENVGGEQLAASLTMMKNFGRIVACGMISQYNNKSPEDAYPIRNLSLVVTKRIKIQGFLAGDPNMAPKYHAEHLEKFSQWIKDGSIKTKSAVTKGIDNSAEGFVGMLQGKNFGKALVEISPLEK